MFLSLGSLPENVSDSICEITFFVCFELAYCWPEKISVGDHDSLSLALGAATVKTVFRSRLFQLTTSVNDRSVDAMYSWRSRSEDSAWGGVNPRFLKFTYPVILMFLMNGHDIEGDIHGSVEFTTSFPDGRWWLARLISWTIPRFLHKLLVLLTICSFMFSMSVVASSDGLRMISSFRIFRSRWLIFNPTPARFFFEGLIDIIPRCKRSI